MSEVEGKKIADININEINVGCSVFLTNLLSIIHNLFHNVGISFLTLG